MKKLWREEPAGGGRSHWREEPAGEGRRHWREESARGGRRLWREKPTGGGRRHWREEPGGGGRSHWREETAGGGRRHWCAGPVGSTPNVTGGRSSVNCLSLFVNNIAEGVNWRDLGRLFGICGEVIDVFIPMKRSKSGRRFGFVRFKDESVARRAAAQLNGFRLEGRSIGVNLARYGSRDFFWRKTSKFIDKNLSSKVVRKEGRKLHTDEDGGRS